MKIKLFECTVAAFGNDEACVSMPGFASYNPPEMRFGEMRRIVYLYARNRTHAAKQLATAGLGSVRDLVLRGNYDCPECMKALLEKPLNIANARAGSHK